ncbi:MAG: hypothetical protein CMF62_02690 [Magnetococcales bacterium]|nr:hypothetical protein [Magnetococcales bacterium]
MFDYNKKLFELIKKQKWIEFNDIINKNSDIDLNIRDDSNNYLLTYAVLFNNLETIENLVKKGSKMDILDNDGKTILYLPIKYNYEESLKLLLKLNKKSIAIPLIDNQD